MVANLLASLYIRGKKKKRLSEDGHLLEGDKWWGLIPVVMESTANLVPEDEVQEVAVNITEEQKGKKKTNNKQ